MIHILWASLAIPILVHLVHRRKAKRILFSTLRFLRMVDQRVARRQRLREMLLLFLRCLLLAAVVGALYHRTIGAFGGGRAQTAVAVVLDNTCSMRTTAGGTQRFTEARKAATRILDGLTAGDSACIVPVFAPSEAAADLSSDRDWLRGELDQMECGYGAGGVLPAVRLALKSLQASGAEKKELYVIGDLQQAAWPSPEQAPAPLPEDVTVILVDVGTEEAPANLTVGRAGFAFDVQVVGLESEFYCTVGNSGAQTLEHDLAFYIAGDKITARAVKVPSGDEREIAFRYAFKEPGEVPCAVELAPDELDADNRRFLVVTVRNVPVLLVDGRPSPVRYLDETFYLEHALRARTGEGEVVSPIHVTVVEPPGLAGRNLSEYACVILANVAEIADPEALREYVRNGGGLVIFSGDAVEPAEYNDVLGTAEDGLLPAELIGVRDRAENPGEEPFRITQLAIRHPVFRGLVDSMPTANCRVNRFMGVRELDHSLILARTNGGPLMVERRLGDGAVILWTTTCDLDWTNLPQRASFFVPVLHQGVYHVARSLRGAGKVHVGGALEVPAAYGRVTSWYGPPAEEGAQEELLEAGGGGGSAPNLLATTPRPGIYRALCSGEKGEQVRLFAVNVDPAESNPARVTEDEAGTLIGAPKAILVRNVERLASVARRQREGLPIWDYLFILAIVAAVLESFVGNVLLKR